jgi:peptidoglycan/LPS O-acetylase OafA/YrhL
MRALAILLVLFGHSFNFFKHWKRVEIFDLNIWNMIVMFINGFDGVDLFFVLSGFLIGGILIKIFDSDDWDLDAIFHFWSRRWLRTIPAYFFVLLINLLLSVGIYGNTELIDNLT